MEACNTETISVLNSHNVSLIHGQTYIHGQTDPPAVVCSLLTYDASLQLRTFFSHHCKCTSQVRIKAAELHSKTWAAGFA